MKNNKTCPKCGSKSIARKRGSPVLNSWSRISINLTSLDVWITRFVCTECGFIEEWVENPNDLKRFKAQD
jgi:predicted RNA-binding Zn-ribbon protein involved in translation (DUF1610 family)